MLKIKGWQFRKLALISVFTVFGLSFSHGAVTSTSSSGMSDVPGHGTNAIQCLGVCNSGLPGDKQEGILQIKRDNEAPDPTLYNFALGSLTFVALIFVIKPLPLLSSWRPPDLIRLYGQRLFYA